MKKLIRHCMDILSYIGVFVFPSMFLTSMFMGEMNKEGRDNFVAGSIVAGILFIPSVLWLILNNYKKLDKYVGENNLFNDRRQFYFGMRIIILAIIVSLIAYSKR